MCINRNCLLSKIGELSYREMISVEEALKVGLNIK